MSHKHWKLVEVDNEPHGRCPDCGKCACCGRQDFTPYIPTYPFPFTPTYPVYPGTPIWTTTTGGTIQCDGQTISSGSVSSNSTNRLA